MFINNRFQAINEKNLPMVIASLPPAQYKPFFDLYFKKITDFKQLQDLINNNDIAVSKAYNTAYRKPLKWEISFSLLKCNPSIIKKFKNL